MKDTYQVRCASGVDPAAIIAMCLVIDEDHDEEDAKRAGEDEEQPGGGLPWPFA